MVRLTGVASEILEVSSSTLKISSVLTADEILVQRPATQTVLKPRFIFASTKNPIKENKVEIVNVRAIMEYSPSCRCASQGLFRMNDLPQDAGYKTF
jgi:hypothetical protein